VVQGFRVWEQEVFSPLQLGTRCSGCSLTKLKKRFFLDFWANISEFFKQDFLLITWSKETIFGFEKLGEDWESIFRKLYSPSNKPLFLENG